MCVTEPHPFLVAYLHSESDAHATMAAHADQYGDHHTDDFVVVMQGDPCWDELHALLPCPDVVGVVCRGPFEQADTDDRWTRRAEQLTDELRHRRTRR